MKVESLLFFINVISNDSLYLQEKRKRREESSQDDVSVGEESLSEPPAKRAGLDGGQPIDEQMLAVAREVDGLYET